MTPNLPFGFMKKSGVSQWWADDDEQFYYASGTDTEGLYVKLILPSGNAIGVSGGNIIYPLLPILVISDLYTSM